MASFPYSIFKRGWRRQEDAEICDNGMHLPLPVSQMSDSISAANSRRSTRDDNGQKFRLLDKRQASKGIVRFGLPAGGWYLYWTDIFHTLLNMPRYRFLLVFFSVYLTEYLIFALLYLTQSGACVHGSLRFSHAMWFSVQTAATLGYTGDLQPNPDCTSLNMLIVMQVITAALIDYCMMGLVFARFASPNKRSLTIRFSSSAVLFQRPEDGLWCLSFRLANIRKHSLISPQISLMLALPADSCSSSSVAGCSAGARTGPAGSIKASGGSGSGGGGVAHYRFQELAIEDLSSQAANLRLGLHAHINHVIRPGSPLYDTSLDSLEALGAEVLCFMEGVDPMTSNNIQGRHSYAAADIRMNERFEPIQLRLRRGELGLDFSGFDATTARALAAGGADEVREGGFATVLLPVPGPPTGPPAAGPGATNSPRPSALVAGGGGNPGLDLESGGGWSAAGYGNAGGGIAGVAHSPYATSRGADAGAVGSTSGGVHTVMAAALSGDMRTHMRALRGQSFRSLTSQLLPSAAGASANLNGNARISAVGGVSTPLSAPASAAAGNPFFGIAASTTHPLAPTSGLAGASGRPSVGPTFGSLLSPPGGAAGGASGGSTSMGASPGDLRELLEAVLTDMGCSIGVKRQAAALKEALSAAELRPMGL
ncbi:hypothetical protein Agub_g58 [Astrephomene gubernaculifera]|uniref:Uncharacterized protein n=1 Tax=Astrephomene gubernaculifera TaxID=47775 RepID=A0AAD3DDD7_9CHLO|nr:hypothetical protein Agub_g58 [Astrephomene gubernaculifera]